MTNSLNLVTDSFTNTNNWTSSTGFGTCAGLYTSTACFSSGTLVFSYPSMSTVSQTISSLPANILSLSLFVNANAGYFSGNPGKIILDIYNTSGTLIASVNKTFTPTSTLSTESVTASSLSGANSATITFVDISGNDWGGNYGLQFSNPQLTTQSTGSLVGLNTSTIVNSFWKSNSSNLGFGVGSITTGATGISSALMSQLTTYSSWNASATNTISNSANDSVWRIYEGHSTPLLASFLIPLNLNNLNLPYTGNTQFGSLIGSTLGISGTPAQGSEIGTYSNDYFSNQAGYNISGGNLTITQPVINSTVSQILATTISNTSIISTITTSTTIGSISINSQPLITTATSTSASSSSNSTETSLDSNSDSSSGNNKKTTLPSPVTTVAIATTSPQASASSPITTEKPKGSTLQCR